MIQGAQKCKDGSVHTHTWIPTGIPNIIHPPTNLNAYITRSRKYITLSGIYGEELVSHRVENLYPIQIHSVLLPKRYIILQTNRYNKLKNIFGKYYFEVELANKHFTSNPLLCLYIEWYTCEIQNRIVEG